MPNPAAATQRRVTHAATLLALAALALPAAMAGSQSPKVSKAALDSAMARATAIHGLVGFQVSVAVDGVVAFQGSNGIANRATGAVVTDTTLFATASVGKAMTAATLLRLWQRGAIQLDSAIDQLVPSFAASRGQITPRLLATHQSGIRHYRLGERDTLAKGRHYANVTDAVTIFAADSLGSRPGKSFTYSSFGYNLLAAALQATSGTPFVDLVTREVLAPLGLSRVRIDDSRQAVGERAAGYSYSDPARWDAPRGQIIFAVPESLDFSYNAGGGNWLASATDLARFGSAFVSPGWLSMDALALTRTPQRLVDGTPTQSSFGWFAGDSDFGATMRVNGAFPGYYADVRVFPEQRIAIAMITNTSSVGDLGYFTGGLAHFIVGGAADATVALEGAVWFQFRRWPQAAIAYRSLTSANPGDQLSWLRLGLSQLNAAATDSTRARVADSALARVSDDRFAADASFARAIVAAVRADVESSVSWLRRARAAGFNRWDEADRDARLEAVRRDPRYVELRRTPR